MKLVVMGAGYVGMALLSLFQNSSHEIWMTTTREERIESLKSYGNGVLYIDKEHPEYLQDLIQSSDGMIVLIAPNKGESYQNTYLKTAKLIKKMLNGREKPFYLLYTGSTSVCQGCENEWATEDVELKPISENGKILLETENLFLDCQASVCILRLGGIYGPGRSLTERAKRMSGIQIQGSGDEVTNHIHLEDIVNAISFCIERSLAGVYHLVNEDHPTRKELYENLCFQLNLPPPIWTKQSEGGQLRGVKISNQKVKSAGYEFLHPHLTKH